MMGFQLERNKYCLCNSELPALLVAFSGPCEAVFKNCLPNDPLSFILLRATTISASIPECALALRNGNTGSKY